MECGLHPEKATRRISSAFKRGPLRWELVLLTSLSTGRRRTVRPGRDCEKSSHLCGCCACSCVFIWLHFETLVTWSSHLRPALPEFCFHRVSLFYPRAGHCSALGLDISWRIWVSCFENCPLRVFVKWALLTRVRLQFCGDPLEGSCAPRYVGGHMIPVCARILIKWLRHTGCFSSVKLSFVPL